MDPANVSWQASMGASVILWAVSSSLITSYESKQDEVCRSRSNEVIDGLFAINLADVTADHFLDGLKNHGLQITPVPDIILTIKLSRSYIIGGLISAFTLAFIPFVIEGAIQIGKQPDEARIASNLISLSSILVTFLCTLGILWLMARFHALEAIKGAAQWDRVKGLRKE